VTVLEIRAKKLQQFTKLCKGDMSQNSKNSKNGFGAILSRVIILTCTALTQSPNVTDRHTHTEREINTWRA